MTNIALIIRSTIRVQVALNANTVPVTFRGSHKWFLTSTTSIQKNKAYFFRKSSKVKFDQTFRKTIIN
jgi:hypothetical protein